MVGAQVGEARGSRMPRCAARRRGRREGRARRRYCSPRWEAGSGGRGAGRGGARVTDAEIRRDEGVGARDWGRVWGVKERRRPSGRHEGR